MSLTVPSQKNRIIELIKRIAYEPTRAEMFLFADTILQQTTAMVELQDFPMGVAARTDAPGVLLGYNSERLASAPDAHLITMLVHETQHLRTGDLTKGQVWNAPRDWYNGWSGGQLHNVARDCQINDQLARLGFTMPTGDLEGCVGTTMLGRNTEGEDIESLMREIASKFPPPPQGSGRGESGEGAEEAQARAQAGSGEEVAEEVGKRPGKAKTAPKPSSVSRSAEQARFDRFLAEILDTRNSKETWYRVPKRLIGVPAFADREAALPYRQPVPRKTAHVYIDVSGSMDDSGVKRICSAIINSPANYELKVFCFDDSIAEWEGFRSGTAMPRRGGGTDFSLVKDSVESAMRHPDAVIVLTDGQDQVPDFAKPEKITWVLYGCDVPGFQAAHGMRSVDLDQIIIRRRR